MDYRLALLLETIDRVSAPLKNVLKQTETIIRHGSNVRVNLNANDRVTQKIREIDSKIRAITTHPAFITIRTKAEQALRVIGQIGTKLKAFAGKVHSAYVSVKDKATPVLKSIKGRLRLLAAGVSFTVVAKMVVDGIGAEQTQKITINRVLENSGQSQAQAKTRTDQYYKYLEDYANKTPFTTQSMAMMGTKSMMIAKGDITQAKAITDSMANVKAFVGDLRTEEEVAEAFFSASQGNLEMLNNMLGTSYGTFDQAMQGIAKNQSGLVEEMATTLPGAISTLKGVLGVQLKEMFKPFSEGMTVGIGKLTEVMNIAGPRLGEMFIQIGQALSPVGEAFNSFLDGIIQGSPQATGIFQLLGTVIVTAFQLTGAIARAVLPLVGQLLGWISSHCTALIPLFETLGRVGSTIFGAIAKALQLAWDGVLNPVLTSLSDLISGLVDTFNALKDARKSAWDFITGHDFSVPSLPGNVGPRFASGSPRIPRDNYPARLHKGEKVLNRREADNYEKRNGGFSLNKLADTIIVREEADIDKVITKMNREIKKVLRGGV